MSHQFKDWARSKGYSVISRPDSHDQMQYIESSTRMVEQAWNAAIASVKREPLSDEQIEAIWESYKCKLSDWDYDGMSVMQETDFEKGARAIEQAHGITATTTSRETNDD